MQVRSSDRPSHTIAARQWRVGGQVQGVGYRPFVYRLAHHHHLTGWVRNELGEVSIHAQGPASALEAFGRDLIQSAPPLARPQLVESHAAPIAAADTFRILDSAVTRHPDIHVPPDYFTCDDCQRELRDPDNRRYRYPFINCTQCGPRYTLIDHLPYDRANTSMAGFPLCPDCQHEYNDPLDRRFHAEPLACPVCGPSLQFYRPGSARVRTTPAALAACLEALQSGGVVAVKGVGGYHLMCDARAAVSIRRLRQGKHRPHKPLAVMVPMRGADGLDAAREIAVLDDQTAAQLRDPMRPIVLVPLRDSADIADNVAPRLREVGLMLPYSPLHHLLLGDFDSPLVATSANRSGEPVLTESVEVEARLAEVAECYLHHNRPIRRPADDPVLRPIAGRVRPIRGGRGNAPLEIALDRAVPVPLLAVGGHMKCTLALAFDRRVIVSPHIGDLGTPRSQGVFEQVIADLQRLYGQRAERLVCDAHPNYASTRWAKAQHLPVTRVFHHHAHASALFGEQALTGPCLVFTWDGAGHGEDGTSWGGEALLGVPGAWRRVASFRPFSLLGGDKVGREPWRSALALCWESGLPWVGNPHDNRLLHHAWLNNINCPRSSAVGRLFDAAAAFTGLVKMASFEAQAPMWLEALCFESGTAVPLPLTRNARGLWLTDWSPLVTHLQDNNRSVAQRAADLHASLAQALCEQATRVREAQGVTQVGLSGGVFQNRVLTGLVVAGLQAQGFEVHLHERVPCNDGGISYGQIVQALHMTGT